MSVGKGIKQLESSHTVAESLSWENCFGKLFDSTLKTEQGCLMIHPHFSAKEMCPCLPTRHIEACSQPRNLWDKC